MVSEQIRKSEENGDEDAVETQDSNSTSSSNGANAKTSDKNDAENSTNGIHSNVSDEGRTLVASAASSLTRMPTIPPPPPPSGKPRSDLGHKPLASNPKRVAPPPPPPVIKASVSTSAETRKDDGMWATISQEVSTIKVESLDQNTNDFKSAPDTVAESKFESLGDDTGEMSAVAEPDSLDSLIKERQDFTASEITGISEDEIDDDDDGPGAELKTKGKSPDDLEKEVVGEEAEAKLDLDGLPGKDEEKALEVKSDSTVPTAHNKVDEHDEDDDDDDDVPHSELSLELRSVDLILKDFDSITSPGFESPEINDANADSSNEELKDLFPKELDQLFPDDLGDAETASPSTTTSEKSETKDERTVDPADPISEDSLLALSAEESTRPQRRSLSSLVAKGKFEKQTYSIGKQEVGEVSAEPVVSEPVVAETPDANIPGSNSPVDETIVSETTDSETTVGAVPVTETSVEETSVSETPVANEEIADAPKPANPLANVFGSDVPTSSGGKLQSIFSQIDLASSTESPAFETPSLDAIAEPVAEAFEVGPRTKPEGKSKFASLLGSSLGETVSMRDIMENDVVPEAVVPAAGEAGKMPALPGSQPAALTADAEPSQLAGESSQQAVESARQAVEPPPHVVETAHQAVETASRKAEPKQDSEPKQDEVESTPKKVEPPAPQPSPLGADGLPEPWLNLGKKTSDSLQAPKLEEENKVDATPAAGTTSSTRTFNTTTPRSTSDDLHWVSTSDNLKKITDKDMEGWVPNAESSGPKSVADELKDDSTTPGTGLSTTKAPKLGSLQRTTTESWTPATQERSSASWDIVPPSDLESATSLDSSSGQNFARTVKDEFGHDDMLLPDELVTSETAEAVFLKGDVTEAARQYHVLIEREEGSEKPNIPQLIQWSESLADLYILMDEPASAVSFYYKARMLSSEPEPRRIQKYLSCLLKLSTRYEEDGNHQEAEKTYLEAIKVAGEELDEKDILHQRINEAYVKHSKRKSENSSSSHTAALEEQCTTLRMRAVKGTDKAFSATKKPTAKEILEETKLEKADKAERNEKIRRATGTEIEFKAARGIEELSGHPMMRVLNSIWVQVILGVMLIMCGLTCMISLRMTESIAPLPVKVELKGTYKTAEELKVVEFKDRNKVGIWDEGAVASGTFKPVRGTTDDLMDLLRGYLRSKTVFYTLDNDLLQDEEGRALYRPDAPERKIIRQMWWYTGFATWHYKEKHCYLTTTQPWNRVNPKFTYVNPFTGKPTYATITATQGAGNKLLPLVVASGQMYEGEPTPGPGAIRCVCFDKVRFFVRGFDRNGKMIQGREPGKAYVIELTDGQNMTEKFMQTINVKNKPGQGKTPLRVIVVTDNKELPSMYKSWTTVAPACILAFLFVSVAVTIIALLRKKDKLKWYHYLSTSAAVAVAIAWFALALQT